MALLSLDSITKLFTRGDEEIRAIDGLSLEVEAGEFIAITGASGSGKSTLLYILGLLDVPSAGRYLLDGSPTESLSDDRRAELRNRFMGFVFQGFHLLPRASALRNVTMPLVYSGGYGERVPEPEQRARAGAALSTVGLADRMLHLPNELSGGQRQRVAIARALVNRPKVLFADEPTGNLDSRSGKEILALFEQLNAAGVTVIMVTHDPSIAQRARRRLVLGDGKLLEDIRAA
jgi:putative ABC transport system ATP-binding protein